MPFRKTRWIAVCLLIVAVGGGWVWGQFPLRDAVFVTAPQITLDDQLRGTLSVADFDLQGVIPVAQNLSFPTGLICTPERELYAAEFSLVSGEPIRTDTPEGRIVQYSRDGERLGVVARVPEVYILSVALAPDGQLYFSTGSWEDKAEFAGVWRVDPDGSADPVQVIRPEQFPELLALLEEVIAPTPPEIRQLTFITGGPFAGDLLFAAGAGTLADYGLYRAEVNGSSVGAPQRVALRGPWHNVAAGPEGALFASDLANGLVARLNEDLSGFEEFASIVEPFYLAVESDSTIYLTTNDFDRDKLLPNGRKTSTLWRLRRFDRLPVGAGGAWGVTQCP